VVKVMAPRSSQSSVAESGRPLSLAQEFPQFRCDVPGHRPHRFVDATNVWIDLTVARAIMTGRIGVMDVPFIVNDKTIDPTDAGRTTNDLLITRSHAYRTW
jgi:hypothetical protein